MDEKHKKHANGGFWMKHTSFEIKGKHNIEVLMTVYTLQKEEK
jgi:hypothetical protein